MQGEPGWPALGWDMAVNCTWDDWSMWEDCSRTCGGGWTRRERAVLVQPQSSSKEFGADCVGARFENKECGLFKCEDLEGVIEQNRKDEAAREQYIKKEAEVLATRAESTEGKAQIAAAEQQAAEDAAKRANATGGNLDKVGGAGAGVAATVAASEENATGNSTDNDSEIANMTQLTLQLASEKHVGEVKSAASMPTACLATLLAALAVVHPLLRSGARLLD